MTASRDELHANEYLQHNKQPVCLLRRLKIIGLALTAAISTQVGYNICRASFSVELKSLYIN